MWPEKTAWWHIKIAFLDADCSESCVTGMTVPHTSVSCLVKDFSLSSGQNTTDSSANSKLNGFHWHSQKISKLWFKQTNHNHDSVVRPKSYFSEECKFKTPWWFVAILNYTCSNFSAWENAEAATVSSISGTSNSLLQYMSMIAAGHWDATWQRIEIPINLAWHDSN